MDTISRGFRIHYLDKGHGPALVLIPGLLMSAARWQLVGYVDAFADGYRVLVVDPLGHGLSDKPHDAAAYLLEDCASDVLAVMDAAGAEAAHVWGYSRGAGIALAVAMAAPRRVLSLVVGGATLQPGPRESAEADRRRAKMITALRAGDWGQFWAAQGLEARSDQAMLERDQDCEAIACVIEAGPRSSIYTTGFDAAVLTRPPLVYVGEREAMREQARIEAAAARARFHVVPGREHAGAFQDIAAVEPVVRAYLAAT